MCRTCPEKVPDLLAYQMLIIEASMVYEGNAWLGYNHRFRQAAACAVNPQILTCGTYPLQAWLRDLDVHTV